MNKKNKLFMIFLSLVFCFISIYHLNSYYHYINRLNIEDSINYEFVKSTEYAGGRGDYYMMVVRYNNNIYEVNITSKMHKRAKENEFPNLSYSIERDEIISDWSIKRSLRIFITFLIISIVNILILIYKSKKGD